MKKFIASVALATSLLAVPASANDSSAAIGLGGLMLKQNDAVSMDSEDLYLSLKKVTVKYRYTNRTAKDVETLISFPLPSIPYGISEYLGDQGYPDWNDLQFTTLVDGKPVALKRVDLVDVNGKDVSARLKELGWPVDYWNNYEFMEGLINLPEAQKQAALNEGLLRHPKDDPKSVEPAWQITTHITRMQKFPAGKTVTVEHSYKPVAGGSVGGMIDMVARGEQEDYAKAYAVRYCMDKAFLSGFRTRHAAKAKQAEAKGSDYGMFYVEHWLDYVLKSGANWRGPIKDFRMVIDKGKADNLVSLCADGIKKIGPTTFEVRKKNFEPNSDVAILIIEWPENE